jgi:hypothetical protein
MVRLLVTLALAVVATAAVSSTHNNAPALHTVLEQIASLQAQVTQLQDKVHLYEQRHSARPQAATPLTPSDVKTFSSVLKGALAINGSREIPCFDLNATGFVTHLWFTIGNGYTARLKIYVDNEATPSIDVDVAQGLASIGWGDETAPWGTTLHGKGAAAGALFSTRRIPFGTRLRIAVVFDTLPPAAGLQSFFFIVHGLEAVSPSTFPGITVAGLQLPPAARLRLYTTTARNLGALERLVIANASSARAGLVHEVFMQANSSLFIYLEACMRLYVDGSAVPLFLSSGTEDYFNSAMYFDGGPFRFENSGLTYKNEATSSMSAYRIHERDPMLFTKGMQLVWRNSEDPLECPFVFPWTGPTSTLAKQQWQQRKGFPSAGVHTLCILTCAWDSIEAIPPVVPVDVEFLVWTYEW